MSHRIFLDTDHVEWQVWDVVPENAERRRAERRGTVAARTDERRRRDRRVITEARIPARPGFENGWLAFESVNENRRLAPIPRGWPELEESELRLLCERAEPARRRLRLTE